MTPLPKLRTRLAVGLVSLAVIGLELALMRSLSVRFWHHFAHLVISLALLGFGASGTALVLLRGHIRGHERGWLFGLALAFALSIPASVKLSRHVPVNVPFISWDFSQLGGLELLSLLVFVPFIVAAGLIGIVLMDRPERIGGHYAANLIGSGLGGAAAVALMAVLTTRWLFVALAGAGFASAILLIPGRRCWAWTAAALVAAGLVAATLLAPYRTVMSQYKMLPQTLAMPGTRHLYRTEGPLGQIDVVAGPATHYAPGLSLSFTGDVPPHALIIIDGDGTTAVYDAERRADWAFLDHTTGAVPYQLRDRPEVLAIGAGGGSDIALARYHESPRVVALEANRRIKHVMETVLAGRGGEIYEAEGVDVLVREARGYLARADATFDVVQLPSMESFGASGAGLFAARESYLYTVEAFEALLDRLRPGGVLCLTRWARTPPRDGLRIFDTARAALVRRGADPAEQLAMIRSWATVTVLAFDRPITADEAGKLRRFCGTRGFDLCYLPGLTREETNRRHVLDRPYYFEGAGALLGPDREAFLAEYPFDVAAATDDRPYFSHFFRWRSLPQITEQMGQRTRAYLEVGYLLLLAALAQCIVLGAVLILAPLVFRAGPLRRTRGKAVTLGYFLLLGIGFMFLEMGFLQRLILYLAHPVYSAAVVIGSFLVFSGVGSMLSGRWARGGRTARVAGVVVAGAALLYLVSLDGWLGLTLGRSMGLRMTVAAITIAPLAVAMGHLFPLGLRQVAGDRPALVPWAWAVNGFASVVATVAAPVVAMSIGFSRLVIVAAVCYAAAAWLAVRLRPAAAGAGT